MKKLIGLLIIALAVSCTCLSQVPPQTIFVNTDCEAILPDYTLQVVATDNCEGLTIQQNPLPGTILTFTTPTVDVEIIAIDAFGNTSESLIVPVVLADSIAPTLIWDGGTIASNERAIPYLWQNILAHTDEAIAHFMYDMSWTQGMPLADTTAIMENLHWFTYSHYLDDNKLALYTVYADSLDIIGQ